MNVALRTPRMTREEFFDWAEQQDIGYEFDGFEPVAMNGGNVRHDRMCHSLYSLVGSRLRGHLCRLYGPNAGLATVGNRVRYPDAIISCARTADTARLIEGGVVVFEILSPGSGHVDRIVKVREYRAVPSILRYVIVEHRSVGATVHARTDGEGAWTTTTLVGGDSLELPEVGVAFPLVALYEDTDLAAEPGQGGLAL
jgi:Uma2 family endonuclease